MKKFTKKSLSVLLAALMLLSCFAVGASAAECEHDYVLDDLIRPTQAADGTWGNGYATYVCTFNSKHQRSAVVARAQYDEYDALVGQLSDLQADAAASAAVSAEIAQILETCTVADNLVILEQEEVDAAVASIRSAAAKYLETYTVTFVGLNNAILDEQTVNYGFAAVEPAKPVSDGFVFIGWDKDFSDVRSDLTVTALYNEGRAYLAVNTTELALKIGESKTIGAVLYSDENVDTALTWRVADASIATVSVNGLVKAVAPGYTTVTVSALNGEVSKSVDVYVYDGQEEYKVQLLNNGMGSFVINGNSINNAYINVKSGQSFRFQFALSSKYNPENVSITANGKELNVDAENYFTIPYVCENMTISVSLKNTSSVTPEQPEEPDNAPAPEWDSCWCHSDGLTSFLWNILMIFCKMLGVEEYHYCACGKAHW